MLREINLLETWPWQKNFNKVCKINTIFKIQLLRKWKIENKSNTQILVIKLKVGLTFCFRCFYLWCIYTAQKMKFSIKDFFSKCDGNCGILSHFLKKSLMENFILCTVIGGIISFLYTGWIIRFKIFKVPEATKR